MLARRTPRRPGTRWVTRLAGAARRLAGYRVEHTLVPVPHTQATLLQRLRSLRVLRLRSGRAPTFEVQAPHWWFGWLCAARVELRTDGTGSQLAWRRLPIGRGRVNLRSGLAILGFFASCIGLGVLVHPYAPLATAVLWLVSFTGFLPPVLFVVTSGGIVSATRRRRLFEHQFERAMTSVVRSVRRKEPELGALTLAIPGHGWTSLAPGEGPQDPGGSEQAIS